MMKTLFNCSFLFIYYSDILMLFILDKDEEINYNTQLNFELSE